MATMNVLDASGTPVAVEKPLAPGRLAATASRPVVLSNEDKTALDLIATQETALNTVFGVKVDAKSSATDGTAISLMSVLKQVSFSIQAAATSLASLVSGLITPGVAGTPSSQVLTVQGAPTGTPQPVSIDAKYETVAASQTAQVLGSTGATGDGVSHLTIIPATTSPGAVTLLDGSTSIPVFVGGTVANLVPFTIALGAKSQSGPWKVTTGANVSVFAVGNFT
jgi:hypothetical protein